MKYTIKIASETSLHTCSDFFSISNCFGNRYSNIIYFIDSNLKSTHLNIDSHLENKVFLPSGESIKSLEEYQKICAYLSTKKLDKNTLLVAIGGGALSDLIGFVASTYLRGIPLAIVPSTLLGMVDASIGGKNGLNFLNSKNQIGTVYQPRYIIICISLLSSLPTKEISYGISEIIKYGFIKRKRILSHINLIDLNRINYNLLSNIINECIEIKLKIVMYDPLDNSLRRILNFGHTIGHALESLYQLPHGIAVAYGMKFSVKLSDNIFHTNNSMRLNSYLNKFKLTESIEWSPAEVYKVIKKDKKIHDKSIDFILISKIGNAVIYTMPLEDLRQYLFIAKKENWI